MPRVTVVNDNPEFLELVHDILEDDRYDPTTVDGDCADALDRIRASQPDLLMIDLRMGTDELHGWRIAQEVRADPNLSRVPIVVCSADVFALRELESELNGTRRTAALMKPFAVDELTDTIDRLLADAAVH